MKRGSPESDSSVARLVGYSAFAGMFCSLNAEAQILYTDLDPDAFVGVPATGTGSLTVPIDFNGDGTPELNVKGVGGCPSSGCTSFYARLTLEPQTSGCSFCGYSTSLYGRAKVNRFFAGLPVSSGLQWLSPFPGLIRSCTGTSLGCGAGPWIPGEGYAGVRYTDSAGVHYGWIRIQVSDDVSNNYVLSYASKQTPGESILAGEADTACNTPPILESTFLGPELKLAWSKVAEADGYKLKGFKVGTPLTITKNVADTTVTMSSISTGTYKWKVRAKCAVGFSAFSPVQTVIIPALRAR